MNDSKKALMAGLLIIASVAAAVGIILAASGADPAFGPRQRYIVYFEPGSDVQGLDDKSPVRLFGAEIGDVKHIQIDDQQPHPRVKVVFEIPQRFVLREDAVITVQSQITGGARLNITHLGEGDPVAPGGAVVGQTLTLGDVMAQINGLIPRAQSGIASITQTSDDIDALVKDVHGRVDHLVAQYDKVMNTAEQALANARDILGDTSPDIRSAMAHINELTDVARQRLPETLDKLDPALTEAKDLMTRARQSMDKVDTILDDGKVVSERVRSIVDQNKTNIDQTLTNVRRASVELKGGIAEIRRAPWRLLKEPDAKDQRNLELFEAARQFADGAHDLQAAAMTIQLAAADPNTDDQHLQQMRTQLAEQIDSFVELRQRLYERFER